MFAIVKTTYKNEVVRNAEGELEVTRTRTKDTVVTIMSVYENALEEAQDLSLYSDKSQEEFTVVPVKEKEANEVDED